jgi:hypothetical protein
MVAKRPLKITLYVHCQSCSVHILAVIFSAPVNIQLVTPQMRAEMRVKALSKWKRVRKFQLSFLMPNFMKARSAVFKLL